MRALFISNFGINGMWAISTTDADRFGQVNFRLEMMV